MRKRLFSALLCLCMVLSLLPTTALAVDTHTLTVTGGTEGTDYQWGGTIYTTYGELYTAQNVLVVLKSTSLTITGDTKDAPGFKDVISINSGVTANLTLNGVNIVSSSSSAGITIAPGGALNLTLLGTNTFQQMQSQEGRAQNSPAIRVPEGASLTVTAGSTGSLTSSTYAGSAVIGGYNKENCGTITINGGTFDLSATGAINVEYIGGPAIGPGAYASDGTVTINGGCIKAYSQWGAAIGSGYNVAMGLVGQENETITINGGTVVATTGHATADGIGGFGGKAITGGVTITGGSVSTLVRNTQPKSSTQNLYKTTLTLSGAGAGTSVSKVSFFLDSGLSETYITTDMKTDMDGKIYVWLPENAIVTAVTAGSEAYTGTAQTTADNSAAGTFIKDPGSYTLTTGAAAHATPTLSKTTGLNAGDTVLLYIAPDSGYELTGLCLYEGSMPNAPSGTSGFAKISNHLWSFTMPAGDRNLYVNMTEMTDTGDFMVSQATGCSYAYDSTANTLTFSGTGNATVLMKNGVSQTSERIVFGSGAAVALTINGLNIASPKGIDVCDTAGNCELILEGSSQISAMDSNEAGIHKGNGTGTLTFSGSGSLNVTMNRINTSPAGSAIGGNKDEPVRGLIFNGGTINANGITNGAGIGTNPSRSATTSLTINGGIIRGMAGNYANGIGTGFGQADQITITGGTVYGSGGTSSVDNGGICSGNSTVTITGGSVNMLNLNGNSLAHSFAQPVNSSSVTLYLTTITVGSGGNLSKNALVTGLTFQDAYSYGINDTYTDASGKLYLWLPVNTVVTGVTTANGTYAGTCTTNETEQSNHYLKGTAEATFSLSGDYFTPVTDITLSSEPGLGATDLSSIAAVSPADATNSSITWAVTEAGSTGASLSGSTLTLSNPGTYTLQATITNGLTSDTDFVKTLTLSVKQPSYITAAAPVCITYGDTLSVPVSFAVSDALDAAVDTGVSGIVKLSKNSDGSTPIATATVLSGKGTLVYQTAAKDLAIGDNILYVVYDGSDTRTTATQTVTVSLARRALTVGVVFAQKTYDGTRDVTISSAELSGKLSGDTVTLGNYSSITAEAAAAEIGTRNVTLSGNFTVSGTDADRYELTQPTGLTVEITRAVGDASVTMEGWTYGSQATNPVPTSITNGTTGVTYQYKVKGAADGTYTATKPTTAGDYTVQATFPEMSSYQQVKATADFTIAKAAASLCVGPVSAKSYGDPDFTLSVTKTGDADVIYSSNNTSVASVDASGKVSIKGAGTATITVSMAESANYMAATPATVEISVDQTNFAGATVSLNTTNFIYNGQSQIPTVTVELGGKILTGGTDYTVSYSNSNGNTNDTTNVGTVTVTVTAKEGSGYFGTAAGKLTYTIGKAPLIVTGATASGRKYDGTKQVSITAVALDGVVASDSGKVSVDTSSLTGALGAADVGNYTSVTLPNMTLAGTLAGNYILTQPTAPFSISVSITQADALSLTGTATMVMNQENYTQVLDLTKLSGYPAAPGGTPVFTVMRGSSYNGLTSAMVDASGKLTLVANNTTNNTTDTVTLSVNGMGNYADSAIAVAINYTDKTPVAITGLTAQNGTYNGATHTGYTGTPSSSYTGTYEITYTGRNGTTYTSTTAPKNAGDYTATFKVPDNDATYTGSVDIPFTIGKATVIATADNKNMATGGTLPAFTVSYAGIATGDTAESIFSTQATASCAADGNTAGSYPITVTTPVLTETAANNYTISASVSGTLTVNSPSTGGSSGGSSGGDSDTKATIPVSSAEGSVKVEVFVKGNAATIGITDVQLKEIVSEAEPAGTIKIDVSGLKVDAAVIPATAVCAVGAASGSTGLAVSLPTGTVTLDKTVLAAVSNKGDIKISVNTVSNSKLTDSQKTVLGNQVSTAVVVDVNVYVNATKTSTFNDGKIQVSVPYSLKSCESADSITVWFVKDDGTIEPKNSTYNAVTGCVEFTTEHLSQYLIVSFPFADVNKDTWYYGSVAYAYNNGLFAGTSATSFSPDVAMTRQMIWMVLARMDGKTPTNMAEARIWAMENGISDGSAPTSPITREQMATILYRYATFKKYETTQNGKTIREFADYDSISEYAQTPLTWAVSDGMMQGSNNNLMPQGYATRAQVAAILQRYCQNVGK